MEFLYQYLPICTFKGSIADLPKSIPFFRNTLIFYITISILIQANITHPLEATIETIVQLLMTLGFVAGLLIYSKALHLFWQTSSAFLVASSFIFFLGMPLIFWLTMSHIDVVIYLLAILAFWNVAIIGFLIKQLLPHGSLFCLMISFVYFIVVYPGSYLLMLAFF